MARLVKPIDWAVFERHPEFLSSTWFIIKFSSFVNESFNENSFPSSIIRFILASSILSFCCIETSSGGTCRVLINDLSSSMFSFHLLHRSNLIKLIHLFSSLYLKLGKKMLCKFRNIFLPFLQWWKSDDLILRDYFE